MSREVPREVLAGWLVVLYAAAAYVLFLYFRYWRKAPPIEQADRWGKRLAVAMLMIASSWGSAGILMFQPAFTNEQFLLTLSLFLVTIVTMAGGVTAYLPTLYAAGPPVALPLVVRMLAERDLLHLILAFGGLVVLGLTVYYGRHFNALIKESFRLRFENVLERKRAEDASDAKSRFLAAASHDLRQPLHTLSLYSAALKLEAAHGAMGEIALHIDKALASLSALVDSLLDISKLDAGAVQPQLQCLSVRGLVARIESDYRPVAREKGLEFRVATADTLVDSDPLLLERLLRNLVDNAFKYTATGSVTLAAERTESDVHITVRDTGPGIPIGERERIFEEFYQIGNPERDRSRGLGLGLAIVRRLTQLLGVKLALDSEPGRGSVFTVTMPLSRQGRPALLAAAPVAASTRGLDGLGILVVDDEPEVRAGMRALLQRLGCTVITCSGYAEAEGLLDEQARQVDLIIADLRLRRHENGIDTVRRLRARLGEIPALLVTGDTAPERLREAQASGLPLLHKPVSADKLTETMRALLPAGQPAA